MKYVTFDTSWLERINYNFSFAPLKCLEYYDYQIIISEIVDEEVKKHLKSKVDDFVTSYNSLLSKGKFIEDVTSSLVPFNNNDCYAKVLGQYDEFKRNLSIEIVPSNSCSIDLVLKQYFNGIGPFSNKNKKSEFPDAIAIDSLIKFIDGKEMYVFSSDNDWKNGFAKHSNVTLYSEIVDINKIIDSLDLAGEIIDSFIVSNKSKIERRLNDLFVDYYANKSIYFADDSWVTDLDLDDYVFDLISFSTINVFEKKENNILSTVIDFNYSFSVDISFYDIESSYYDKEEKKMYFAIRRFKKIAGDEIGHCYIDFSFETDDFGKIIDYSIKNVDFGFSLNKNYEEETKPVEEKDYHDIPF